MLLDMGQQIIVAEPLSSAGNGSLFAARPVFPGKRGGAAAAASSSAGGSGGGGGRYGNLAAGELVGAGPFFLDLKNGAGPPPGAGGARPATRFVAGSRMAKARESAKRRGPAAGPADKRDGQQRDAAGLEREVADLRDAATKADRRRKELQSKLVKAEKEAARMQKLVSDVLVEQKPAMAQEFRKLLAWKGRVAALEDEKRKLTEQLARYEADVKVQTARQLKDEVTAYQLELERLRGELAASQKEAAENARIARLARKKVVKTKQRTEVQTKRQTERVLAARHSADLEALGKQSRLLKREIKSMQGKDWVVECARLESMLQQAYTIVKHVEAQREESIMQQEDMRAKIIELDAALEVELGAAGEEKKRTVAAEKRLQRCEDEVSRFHERCMVLEEQLMAAEKRLTDQKVETGRSEAQLRRVFQHGFDRIRKQELKRRLQTWGRAATAQIAMRQRAELKDLRDRPLPAPVVIGGDLEAAVEKLEEENSLLRDRYAELEAQLSAAREELEQGLAAGVGPMTSTMGTEMTPARPAPPPREIATQMTPPPPSPAPAPPSPAPAPAPAPAPFEPPVAQRKPSMRGILDDIGNELPGAVDWAAFAALASPDDEKPPPYDEAIPFPEPEEEPTTVPVAEPEEPAAVPEPEPAPDVEVEAEPEPEPAAPVVRPSIAGETMHTAMPEGEEEQKLWAATKIQAIERGRRWRQRIAAFERWDKTSGEGDFLQPRVAPEGVQCTSIPKQHLLDGEHFTPLGLRLAKQLFMLLDEDGDERLNLNEMAAFNTLTAETEDDILDLEALQELTLMFDSDAFGLSFAGFLDLYRMEDMDLSRDAYKQRLTHARNMADIPTRLPKLTTNESGADGGYLRGRTSPKRDDGAAEVPE